MMTSWQQPVKTSPLTARCVPPPVSPSLPWCRCSRESRDRNRKICIPEIQVRGYLLHKPTIDWTLHTEVTDAKLKISMKVVDDIKKIKHQSVYKWVTRSLFFFIFVFWIQLIVNKICHCVGSDRSTNWATTTAPMSSRVIAEFQTMLKFIKHSLEVLYLAQNVLLDLVVVDVGQAVGLLPSHLLHLGPL